MPELPEVEFVARALRDLVSNRRIRSAELLRERLVPDCCPVQFSRFLINARINSISRRGKHILFDLDNGRTLLTHLRMTGRFMLLGAEKENPKFSHAIFHFADGERLVFDDQRHFGMMKIFASSELANIREISKLAPEPHSNDFSQEFFHNVLRRSRRPVKELLLDQTKVCGLGNIYASEALFLAGISPKRRSDRLSRRSADHLHAMIRGVLSEAVELGTAIAFDPENIAGSIYGSDAAPSWRIYGREGEACQKCGAAVRRIVQGGRSTFYCPACQR